MDFENVIYGRSIVIDLDKEKGARETVGIYVTREVNCILVWRRSIAYAYRGDDDPNTEVNVLKSFRKAEREDAIEYAVDWISKQKLE